MSIRIYDVRENPGDSAFLIDDGETAIMYDSGFAFTGDCVAQNIKKILGDRGLNYIFLTHSHYDHALGAVYALKYWPEVKIVAGEYAAKIFAKDSAKEVMRDLDRKFAKTCGVEEYEDLIDLLHVDMPVANGDVITAGNMKFSVLNLPGHTKCSIGYYCEDEDLFLSCESIGVFNGKDDVVPSYLVGYNMAMDSIRRVRKLAPKTILVPHFGVINGDMAEMYLDKAESTTESLTCEIVEKLKAGESKESIMEFFEDRFYHDYIKIIYPIDAMKLNTEIMINLLSREFNV